MFVWAIEHHNIRVVLTDPRLDCHTDKEEGKEGGDKKNTTFPSKQLLQHLLQAEQNPWLNKLNPSKPRASSLGATLTTNTLRAEQSMDYSDNSKSD